MKKILVLILMLMFCIPAFAEVINNKSKNYIEYYNSVFGYFLLDKTANDKKIYKYRVIDSIGDKPVRYRFSCDIDNNCRHEISSIGGETVYYKNGSVEIY